jgi:hypothetical protein
MYEQLFSFNFDFPSSLSPTLPKSYDLAYSAFFVLAFAGAEIRMQKVDFDEVMSSLKPVFRWPIYYALILIIVLFGVMENAPQFIYFQF